jgi:hypothetical protein
MHRKRILIILTVLVILLIGTSPALAANLYFQVEREEVNLFINDDGTATVTYLYVFVNTPSGAPIDFVDIGVPTSSYSLSNVSATIDDQPVATIEESPYVTPGVAVGLGSAAIPPGGRGTLKVTITGIGKMLYKTNKVQDVKEPYASFQFSPNSFGSEYVSGNSDVTVTLHLPAGLAQEEPRWFTPQSWLGGDQPASGFDNDNRVFYRWQSADANVSSQYIFGAAFPQRLVPATALVTEPVISSSAWESLCPALFCVGFLGFFGLIIWASIVGNKKRRLSYLPPKISLEGNGIKRGLTAVEAAILMEQPMDKILSMILFAVVKKGAATVTSRDPLTIQSQALPAGSQPLQAYEADFVTAMTTADAKEKRKLLQDMMVSLVKSVSEKMRGFSRKETVAYYQDIMTKAWQQVEAADTPEVRMQAFDQNMDWTMLDRRFDDRSREVLGRGPVFVPMWWGRYDPGLGRSTMNAPTTLSGPVQIGQAPSSSSMPSLPGADFAASVAGGLQSFSSNVVGDITNFTSGVTNTTNPVPKPTYSSSRSGSGGGGRSCACACACAGCACACAGGGR